jgi:hypothetical protein
MSIWNNIFNDITDPTINLVYMSIGCSMEDSCYDELTEENNQQYPCFLNNFTGNKLIILIDPYLETNLKIEKYFIQKGNPLISINTILDDKLIVRVFKNDKVTVYALNEPINYISNQLFNQEDSPDAYKIYNIINMCLDKINKCKFILQDFSGNDTSQFYSNLLKIFDRNDILNHVNMDVTQDYGGCRFKLTHDLVSLDEHGNFIQEKFMELSKIKDSKIFNTILKYRIDMFLYPIGFYYSKLIESPEYELDNVYLHKISLIAIIYDIEYNPNNKDPKYIIPKLLALIDILLKDIINAKELGNTYYDHILNIIDNRKLLYETIKVLKLE